MMKIDHMGARGSFMIAEHETNAKVGKKNNRFSAELMHSQEEFSEERLKELLDKIDKQGARLTETPTYAELKAYRELVKTFVGEAVS